MRFSALKSFYSFTLIMLFICGVAQARVRVDATAKDIKFLHELHSIDDWHSIAHRPITHRVSRAEVIKFIIIRKDMSLYLVNTKKWDIHYNFVRDNLNANYNHKAFNAREYAANDRHYIMGSLVHYLDGDIWVMEIAPSDTMSVDMIKTAHKKISQAISVTDKIYFRSQSSLQEKRITDLKGAIPILSRDDFQKAIQYQPLTLSNGFGYLRFVKGELDPATVRPDQIIITEYVPDDLPVCAGLITSQLQAPLAHISILLEGRKTANMALRNAVDNADLKALDGKLVQLTVKAQDYTLTPATLSKAERWWAQHRPAQSVQPKITRTGRELLDICDVDLKDIGAVGGKASYMGGLCSLKSQGIKTPDGFVVPISEYLRHLEWSGIDSYVGTLLQSKGLRYAKPIEVQLRSLQNAIKSMPISPQLLQKIRQNMKPWGDTKVILRSSANAEDIQGFTGAGLYSSKTLSSTATDAELSHAIRTVWASLWNIRAYKERDWYRIDHKTTAMAILVQPFVPELIANGVAITANPFHHRRPGYFVNAQIMKGTITSAKDGGLPESLLLHTFGGSLDINVLSRSKLNRGKQILSKEVLEQLVLNLDTIHKHFIPEPKKNRNKAMDVEFLINKTGEIIIVQARPYHVNFRSEAKP